MVKPQAYSVMFQGYGRTEEGGAVFVFALPNGRMMPLALAADQVPKLLAAAAAVAGQGNPAGRDPSQGAGMPPEGAGQPAGIGGQTKANGAPAQTSGTRISSEVSVDKGRREIRLSLSGNPLSVEEAEKLAWELSQALAVLQ